MFPTLTAVVALLVILGAGSPTRAEEGKSLHIRGKVRTVVLIGLLHASVTVDAWSTNRLFNDHPPGYRPVEYNPLLSPFAGKPSVYLMANLLTIPADIFLLKYRRHPRFAEALIGANIGFEAMLISNNLRTLDNARRNWEKTQTQIFQPPATFTLVRPKENPLPIMPQPGFRTIIR